MRRKGGGEQNKQGAETYLNQPVGLAAVTSQKAQPADNNYWLTN